MSHLRLLEVSGSPIEMGRQHATAYPTAIQELAEDRLQLSSNKNWTGKTLSRQEVLALGNACLPDHQAYAPDLMEELRGMREVTGLGLAELVILNGFTDFIDVVYRLDPTSLNRAFAHETPDESDKEAKTSTLAHPTLDDCTAFIVSPEAAAEGLAAFLEKREPQWP